MKALFFVAICLLFVGCETLNNASPEQLRAAGGALQGFSQQQGQQMRQQQPSGSYRQCELRAVGNTFEEMCY